jgi:hypothetical protein
VWWWRRWRAGWLRVMADTPRIVSTSMCRRWALPCHPALHTRADGTQHRQEDRRRLGTRGAVNHLWIQIVQVYGDFGSPRDLNLYSG